MKGRKLERDIETIWTILEDVKNNVKYKEIAEKHCVQKSMITYYKRKFMSPQSSL